MASGDEMLDVMAKAFAWECFERWRDQHVPEAGRAPLRDVMQAFLLAAQRKVRDEHSRFNRIIAGKERPPGG